MQSLAKMCEAIESFEHYTLSRAVDGVGAEAGAAQSMHALDKRSYLSDHRIGPAPPPRTVSAEMMIDWLTEHGVLAHIFDVNSHVEMMRRSVPIMKFLARRGALTHAMIDRLWVCVTVRRCAVRMWC
jgi:hypothetical protein